MKVASENKYHLYDNDKTSQISFNKHSNGSEQKKGEVKDSSPADPTRIIHRRLSVIKESTEEINDKGSPVKIKKITEQKQDK